MLIVFNADRWQVIGYAVRFDENCFIRVKTVPCMDVAEYLSDIAGVGG
ncbi:MAG: hypothetical protein ACT6FF_07315 [Methanosarcinaceae archaeon]